MCTELRHLSIASILHWINQTCFYWLGFPQDFRRYPVLKEPCHPQTNIHFQQLKLMKRMTCDGANYFYNIIQKRALILHF